MFYQLFANVYGLHQLISEHTGITDKSSALIDLVFTNTPDRVVCSGVSHIGISDHSLVFAFCKVSTESTKNGHATVKYRKFKNFDSTSFRHDISQQNWHGVTLKAVLIQIQCGRHGNNYSLNALTSTHHFVKSVLVK